MTKKEQEHMEQLRAELASCYEEIRKMQKNADKNFENSPKFRNMRIDLALATTLRDYEDRFRREHKADLELMARLKKLEDDNRALCQAHDVDYWIGLGSVRHWDYSAYENMEKELARLRAEVAAKDEVINHLKSIIAGEEPESPGEKRSAGRPKTDDVTVKRIRKYRRAGWTIRQIAAQEGISTGTVSEICKGIKPSKDGTQNKPNEK
ncbi:MAG: helix-turn-helix transcriptional regulator [Lachnospiraceae bacterium]|nr:helix-turn-helix transcriptional regulator [Lachnospiraceae bacterium]